MINSMPQAGECLAGYCSEKRLSTSSDLQHTGLLTKFLRFVYIMGCPTI